MPRGCPYSVDDVVAACERNGYEVFRNPQGYDLNLVGIRTADMTSNSFNDWLTVFYDYDDRWNYFAFPCTTDPGVFYRQNPLNVKGTAIVVPGQYRGVWTRGKHRGRYKALVQAEAITVWRDADRDEILEPGPPDRGFHGINLHRAGSGRASVRVDKWSAGCQVLQDRIHFSFVIGLCDQQFETHGWNTFTYTLLEEGDFT